MQDNPNFNTWLESKAVDEKTGEVLLDFGREKILELAEKYNVSIRTIQRDIFEIESTFHAPIVTQRGHYGGGVSIVGNYSFDHAYMNDAEIALLQKIQKLVKNQCSESENALLAHIIQKYKISA